MNRIVSLVAADKAGLLENVNKFKIAVVKFSASWCSPCKQISAPLEALVLSKENPDTGIIVVDIDENDKLSEEYNIKAMPTILFYANNHLMDTVVGTDMAKIREAFSKARKFIQDKN